MGETVDGEIIDRNCSPPVFEKTSSSLSTEKVIEYKDIATMNSYHIGNGVVAELTF